MNSSTDNTCGGHFKFNFKFDFKFNFNFKFDSNFNFNFNFNFNLNSIIISNFKNRFITILIIIN